MSELLAFVDESIRPGRYLLGMVVVDANRAGSTRRVIRKLLLPGQRKLHFKTEGVRRRKELVAALVPLELDASVYVCRLTERVNAASARARCLGAAVRDVQQRGRGVELYLESREALDRDDARSITKARSKATPLTFQHLRPDQDPLLWLPDAFAWCVGAGGEWRRRVGSTVRTVDLG